MKENLQRIWNCLVTKAPEIALLIQPRLKREEIDEITKILPFKLPEEAYELYQWRNGLSKEIGLYNWQINEITVYFESLETTIQTIKKLIISDETVYFIIPFWFSHQNGAVYFAIPLGQEISSIIILYDDDDFEYFDFEQEFLVKSDKKLIKDVEHTVNYGLNLEANIIHLDEQKTDDLFQTRKIYGSLQNFIAEIADYCEQGFKSLEINEYGYISVYLNQKCSWIHYKHRFAKKQKNIYCLTLEQEAQLYETKQSWLNLLNTSLNHEKAAKVIRELYAYAGEEIPDIVFVPSFYTAHLGILRTSDFLQKIENSYLAEKLKSLYWDLLLIPFDFILAQPVTTSVLTSLKSELSDFLDNFIEDDLKNSITNLFENEISPKFKNAIDLLYSALKYDLKETLGENFIQLNLNYKYILGNEELISSAALFEFADILGVKFDKQKLNLFVLYCREVWCIIPFDKTILVCEKPRWGLENSSLPPL